jgi:hypothetical protein
MAIFCFLGALWRFALPHLTINTRCLSPMLSLDLTDPNRKYCAAPANYERSP